MKLSIVMLAAAAVYAAPADDQAAALAPDQEGEMKQLLSMDSFNITSADSEQNRMHAVCDMEYRLSKMTGNRGLATMNLASANTNVAALFNPFTMPLMAVKQHIALLQQEEKFLQAQSDAFGGSSSATTTTPSTVAISKCQFVATGATAVNTPTATGSRGATDSLEIAFTTETAAAANQILQITVDIGDATSAVTFTNPSPALTGTAFGAGTSICQNVEGTDGPCKNAAGAAMSTTANAAVVKPTTTNNPEGTASTTSGATEVATATAKDVTAGNKGIIIPYTLAEGLDVMKASYWYLGVVAGNSAGATAKNWKVTMEFLQGTAATATLLGKATCTSAN